MSASTSGAITLDHMPPIVHETPPSQDLLAAVLTPFNGEANLGAQTIFPEFPRGAHGQIAGNRSSFDVRNYGFKSLKEMFDSFDNFAVEKRDDNQIYVKRLR